MKGTLWSSEEDKTLIELRKRGLTNREISERIPGRSIDSVISRQTRIRMR